MDELNKVYGEVKGASVLDRGPWRTAIAHKHLPMPVQEAVRNIPREIPWLAWTVEKAHPRALAKYISLRVTHRCRKRDLPKLSALIDAIVDNHFVAKEHRDKYRIPIVGKIPILIELEIGRRKSLMVTIKKQTFKEKNRQAK